MPSHRFSISSGLKKIVPSNQIALFLLKLLVLFLIWHIIGIYIGVADSGELFVRIWVGGYHILLKTAMFLTVHVLPLFTDVQISTTYNTIILENHGRLIVGNPCLCDDVLFLFAAFIIAYPGQWKPKLWYIPMGMLMIHLVNVMRMIALCLTQIYRPEWMHLNHKYIFNVVIIVFVFILWIIWISRFSKTDLFKKDSTNKEN